MTLGPGSGAEPRQRQKQDRRPDPARQAGPFLRPPAGCESFLFVFKE